MSHSITKSTLLLTVSSFIFVITSYFTNLWLGRYLGPATYGIYGVIITLMTAINLTQNSGVPQSIAKHIAENENKVDQILNSGLSIQLISTSISTIGLFLLATPIATFLNDPSLVQYIQASCLILPFYGIYALYLNYFNGLHSFGKQAVLGIIYAIAKMLFIIVLVYTMGIYGAILGFILAPIAALIYGFRLPNFKVRFFPLKPILLFSMPLIGFAIMSNLMQSIDLIFVKSILNSDTYTGYYTAAQNISKIPFYGVIAIASVIFPSISRSISQNNITQAKTFIYKSLRISFLILLPVTLLISATSKELTTLLYSSVYLQAAQPLSILVVGVCFVTVFTILATILSSIGKAVLAFNYSLCGVLLIIFLCYLFIPTFGINGAAIATTIGSFTMVCVAAITIHVKLHSLYSLKSFMRILLASFIIYIFATVIHLSYIFVPVLYLFLFCFYIFLLYVFREFSNLEVTYVTSYISRIK